jgi:hypothetical protein
MEFKEYLELKPKYLSFLAKQERKIKPTRPPSKKAALKAKSDAEFVSKAVLAVKGETNADRPIGGVQEGFFNRQVGFLPLPALLSMATFILSSRKPFWKCLTRRKRSILHASK